MVDLVALDLSSMISFHLSLSKKRSSSQLRTRRVGWGGGGGRAGDFSLQGPFGSEVLQIEVS